MDDVALVAAVQRGDEEALADLFEECHGWAYSTCLNALRDPDAAEEASARVFEVAIRTRLAGARELRPVMIRLIYDACIEVEHELLRRRRGRRKGEQPPAAPDPKDLRLVAWRAAGDLTGPDRILFALAAAVGLTTESIAAAISPDKPAAIAKRLDEIREHVVADVLAARSLDDCPQLRDTLRYAAKEPDAAARKKVHAHLAGRRGVPPCAKCTAAYERWPLAALAALLPLTAVPFGMNDRLLDRMELALRAGLAAGTDRTRAVNAPVIDGVRADVSSPRRPPVSTPAQAAPSGRPTAAGPRREPQGGTSRGGSASGAVPPDWDAPTDVFTTPRPGASATANGAAAAAGSSPTADTSSANGAAAPGAPAPGAPTRGRTLWTRPSTTTAILTATVLVLGVAGVVALATHRAPASTVEGLIAGSTTRAAPGDESLVALPPARPGPSPSPTSTRITSPEDAEPVGRTSPTASGKQSIRPVAGSVAPTTPAADPFHMFGTLSIASPAAGSTVGFYDVDARLASVTLAVAVPDGFDATLLDSRLTWSGTYVLRQETQYVNLGTGQGVTVDLQGAARCTTVWTITAAFTPPGGSTQYATTDVSITC